MLNYISVKGTAEKWEISERRIQKFVKKTALKVSFVSVIRG